MADGLRVRVRDPIRKERIFISAVELIAQRGYQSVNLEDIGSAAGIVGSGIYRHFESKIAILVELFERVVDRLIGDAERSLQDCGDPPCTLRRLVTDQIVFTVTERSLCQVYVSEAHNLPEADARRLRWKQRHYIDLWHDVLMALRPDLSPGAAQSIVYAAIGSIHSVLRYEPLLEGDALIAQLLDIAMGVLGVPLADTHPSPRVVAVAKDADQ